jgi:hypothetical protein
VNDTVAGVPIAVTFCPLCNSGIVFDRRTAQGMLDFGVTGKLHNSDMVMYNHQTHSWWQQAQGLAIVGKRIGTQLTALTSCIESWDQFRARAQGGILMDEPAGGRQYGRNPYARYDSSVRPSLYSGDPPPHGIQPLARIVRVGTRAWPLTRLRGAGIVHEAGVTLSWEAGRASALDAERISEGRDVGTVRVRDARGRNMAHDVLFAFAFHAFWPDGVWMLGQ